MNDNVLTENVGFDKKQKILDDSRDSLLEVYQIAVDDKAQILFKDVTESNGNYNVLITTEGEKSLERLIMSAKELNGSFPNKKNLLNPNKLAILNHATLDIEYTYNFQLTLDRFTYSFSIPFKKLEPVPQNLLACCNQEVKLVKTEMNIGLSLTAVYKTNSKEIYFI